MITKATVIDTCGTKARVRIMRQSACEGCEGCSENGKCHSEIMLSESPKTYELEVENPVNAKTGDVVEVHSAGNFVLAFAFFVFLLPIFITVIAYIISVKYFQGVFPVIISGISLFVSFAVFAFVSNKIIPRFSHNEIRIIIKESSLNTADTNEYKK